jgi:hypothetical protein
VAFSNQTSKDNDVLLVPGSEPGGRFFMDKWCSTRRELRKLTVLFLLAWPLLACTASLNPEKVDMTIDPLAAEAFREREIAWARLTRAITTYCSIRHASLEARQSCVLDRQMEAAQLRELRVAHNLNHIEAHRQSGNGNRAGSTVKCESAGLRTTCWRTQPALSDLRTDFSP